jgi:outer membrane receptor protein involved in Fe transport
MGVMIFMTPLASGASADQEDLDVTASAPAAATVPASPEPAPTPVLADDLPTPIDTSLDLSLSLEDLLNVTVVTAGAEEERALASANIFVVTRAEIEQHGYRSLVEVLAAVPGVYVIDDFVTPSIAVRGVSGGLGGGTRIVRMMIDGAQVNFRPDLTAFLGPEYIPMEAVERVEIAKGPLSALYGANAFLATVNVITRSPPSGVTAEVAARSHWTRSAGSLGTSGLVAFKKGRTSFLSAFTFDRMDRSGLGLQRTFPAQDNTPQIFGSRSVNDLARPEGLFLSIRTGSKRLGTLSLAGGLQQMDAMGEFQVNSLLTHHNRLAIQNIWSNARWERVWSAAWKSALMAGAAQGGPAEDTSLYLTESRSSFYVPNYSYRALNGGAHVEWAPTPRLSLRLGFDGELDQEHARYYSQVFNVATGTYQPDDRVDVGMGAGNRRTELLTDLGVYLQAASTPFPNGLPGLRLTGNLRLDAIKQGDIDFPLQTSWRLAAAYRISSSLSAKVVGGRAFQTPSGVLTFGRPGFGSVGNIVGTATIVGLPALHPQTVDSVEVNASGRLFRMLTLEGGLFYQRVEDRIEFVRYGANYRATNQQGSTSAAGVEGALRLSHRRFSTYLTGCIQRTITDGSLSSEPTASYPNAFGQVGADLSVPELYFRADGQLRLVSTRRASQGNITLNNGQSYTLPAYTQLNLTISSLGLHPLGPDTETRVLFGVRNLLNVRWSEPGYAGFDIPTLGRVFIMELRQLF